MTIKVRDANVTQTATAIKPFHLGVLRTARTVKVYEAGALRTVFETTGSLTASASPAHQTAVGSFSLVTSSSVTVTPSGGTGPYSYSWELNYYTDGVEPTISNPTFASTVFRQSGLSNGDFNTASFICTVTDSLGAIGTAEATVDFMRETGV